MNHKDTAKNIRKAIDKNNRFLNSKIYKVGEQLMSLNQIVIGSDLPLLDNSYSKYRGS